MKLDEGLLSSKIVSVVFLTISWSIVPWALCELNCLCQLLIDSRLCCGDVKREVSIKFPYFKKVKSLAVTPNFRLDYGCLLTLTGLFGDYFCIV
jgi:hypothetical protein